MEGQTWDKISTVFNLAFTDNDMDIGHKGAACEKKPTFKTLGVYLNALFILFRGIFLLNF